MLTRHHILLTLGYTLLVLIPFIPPFPLPSLVILAGAGIGSVLPDFHMKRPSRWKNPKNLAYVLTRVTLVGYIPLLMVVSRTMFRLEPDPMDKRMTHSFPALLLFGISVIVVNGLFAATSSLSGFMLIPVFISAVFLGTVLHLVEDACTKKGICPFFPLGARLFIVGTIRPCDTSDRKIPLFILMVFMAAGGLFIAGLESRASTGTMVLAAFALLFACITVMLRSSHVTLEDRDERRFRAPRQVAITTQSDQEEPSFLKI